MIDTDNCNYTKATTMYAHQVHITLVEALRFLFSFGNGKTIDWRVSVCNQIAHSTNMTYESLRRIRKQQ